jgi:pimeloyl-ACP methyl ester carboxylesterase
MTHRFSAAIALSCALLSATAASAQDRPAYGPRLEGYDYPHPVRTFAFTSQRQPLEMTYMDVAPGGPANGRTVVLLHGKNFCAATWAPTIEVLSQAGFRVLAVDQIGFCKASKPQGYQFSLAQLAANTRALMTHAEVERAVIVGHSMGGMLGARFAIQHPEAVERLVLVNPIGLEDWQAEGVPYALLDAAYETELKTSFDSIKAYQRRFYYDGDWKPDYDAPVEMLAGMYMGSARESVAWNQAQTSDMIFTQPVVHELGRIAAPTTLIIGQTDRTAPGANRASPEIQTRLGDYPLLGRRTAEAIPNATLVEFEDLGHAPQIEDPTRFHRALLDALGD